jgi:hypothetical protein
VPTAVAVQSRNVMCVEREGLELTHKYDSVISRWFYLFEHLNDLQCQQGLEELSSVFVLPKLYSDCMADIIFEITV